MVLYTIPAFDLGALLLGVVAIGMFLGAVFGLGMTVWSGHTEPSPATARRGRAGAGGSGTPPPGCQAGCPSRVETAVTFVTNTGSWLAGYYVTGGGGTIPVDEAVFSIYPISGRVACVSTLTGAAGTDLRGSYNPTTGLVTFDGAGPLAALQAQYTAATNTLQVTAPAPAPASTTLVSEETPFPAPMITSTAPASDPSSALDVVALRNSACVRWPRDGIVGPEGADAFTCYWERADAQLALLGAVYALRGAQPRFLVRFSGAALASTGYGGVLFQANLAVGSNGLWVGSVPDPDNPDTLARVVFNPATSLLTGELFVNRVLVALVAAPRVPVAQAVAAFTAP